MGRLIYSVMGSLDGFINDATGSYDWAYPGEDVATFIEEQISTVSTYIYGRRMYEEMQVWETDPEVAADSAVAARFAALWQGADKVVFSSTLRSVPTRRTRLESAFDAEAVRRLVEDADGDATIEGPTLAAHALRAGVVDEIHRFIAPVVVGGGTSLYPPHLRLDLELVDQRRLTGGFGWLRYRVR